MSLQQMVFMIEDFIVFATNGFYDRGLHCLCNMGFYDFCAMIEDFIVYDKWAFHDRGLCNKWVFMIEDFTLQQIVCYDERTSLSTNGFL